MIKIVFVCLGNICRSPAAEGVMKHLLSLQSESLDIEVIGCGIGDWHLGQLPDLRMRKAASERNIILSSRAKQFESGLFEDSDYILAADNDILENLFHLAKTPSHKAKVHLMTAYSKSYLNQDIPDPYYGNHLAFNLVLDILKDSCEGLLEEIKKSGKN